MTQRWGVLAVAALLACSERDAARGGLEVGDASVALISAAKNLPPPWLVENDPADRTHPAYGIAQHHMANVFEQPSKSSRVLGYLRRGARFRASEQVSLEGCAKGWFEALGGGFVCNGEGVTVAANPPKYNDPPILPALSDPLPYRFMKTTKVDVPQYLRMPTPEEELAIQAAFAKPLPKPTSADAGVNPLVHVPPPLLPLVRMRMQPGFYVSVDRQITDEATGRSFYRSVRGGWIRAEELTDSKQPQGLGVTLGGRLQLPLAFVYRPGMKALRLHPVSGEPVKAGDDLKVHSAHGLTGKVVQRGGVRYYVTTEGLLLRDQGVRIIEKVARPKHTGKAERWIRVDLDRQTLTAYEAGEPVFATLISSGLDDHATPVGVYRLHAKHVATTMADDVADGPYSIEDVPWTMYFLGSYALHAAFWHDKFGNQRSHGCVNLAPRDARWLFYWSAPDVPSGWHGSIAAIGKGTVVALDKGSVYALEAPGS
jgi:hypothetical protein